MVIFAVILLTNFSNCNLYKEGIFAGGSSGSVVAAIQKLLPTFPQSYRVLTLFPDRRERYLDLVYDDAWVAKIQRRTIEAQIQIPPVLA